MTGFDTAWATLPCLTCYVRGAKTEEPVRTLPLDADLEAQVEALSGDHVRAQDISRVGHPGEYVVTYGDSWPLNSWQVSENSNADQAAYL